MIVHIKHEITVREMTTATPLVAMYSWNEIFGRWFIVKSGISRGIFGSISSLNYRSGVHINYTFSISLQEK